MYRSKTIFFFFDLSTNGHNRDIILIQWRTRGIFQRTQESVFAWFPYLSPFVCAPYRLYKADVSVILLWWMVNGDDMRGKAVMTCLRAEFQTRYSAGRTYPYVRILFLFFPLRSPTLHTCTHIHTHTHISFLLGSSVPSHYHVKTGLI